MKNERELYSIAFMDEYQIVFSPKCKEKLGQILFAEIIFRLLHVHNQAFIGQRSLNPLLKRSVSFFKHLNLSIGYTYIENLTSVLLINRSPCDAAEAREEPHCVSIY